ncbi:MAG TPA: M4 family metallopeptidase [Actinomycetes bacterium]
MRPHALIAAVAGALLTTGLTGVSGPSAATGDSAGPAGSSTGTPARGGSFTLTGADAVAYQPPADLRQVRTTELADGTTQTRYQQVASGAEVLNGQVTVLRDARGTATAVIGAYFPGLRAKNDRKVTPAEARSTAAARVGNGDRTTTFRIDPQTGRTFYQVITQQSAHRWLTWVDAGSRAVRKNIDTVAEGTGTGVKGDTKTISTTQRADGMYQLVSQDGRQATYDSGNTGGRGTIMTDADDVWDLLKPPDLSPSQPAGVDAHYYADVVDDFYGAVFGRDSIDDNGMQIISSVHYGRNYNNAFWSGAQMAYGDGDGKVFRPLSGGLDVVGHELTHGVTQYTSGLIYENESGALNESFSDMMGNTVEYFADAAKRDPAATPDWFIGEDVYVPSDTEPGFRNMTDPQEDADPDHYSELYTGTADNGGVHSNSGISNHVYYLAVNGGRNAGCGTSASSHTHTANCDENVAGLGLATARNIFYTGMTSLTEYANFCDARNATMAAAAAGKQRASVGDAWDAVGVTKGCTPGSPPPPPCTGGEVQMGVVFSTPHPYGNNGDCTWTYTNTSGGSFAFVFDKLETEAGYDYVYVKDAAGNVVATYDGTPHRLPVTSPCLSGPSGSVQLVSDGGVTAYGFDARVVAC